MDVERTMKAVERADRRGVPLLNHDEGVALLEAAEFALEVLGAGCALWTEGVCGGRLVDGLCGTHQPTEPIPLPDPNEWMKETK